MSNVFELIGENMDLENLIGKNISVGKRLFSHSNYLNNLKENSYFTN